MPFLFLIEAAAERPEGGTGKRLSLKNHEIKGHVIDKCAYSGSRGVVQEREVFQAIPDGSTDVIGIPERMRSGRCGFLRRICGTDVGRGQVLEWLFEVLWRWEKVGVRADEDLSEFLEFTTACGNLV